jgi:glycosyltransferase involved in cell wall biosynthesis
MTAPLRFCLVTSNHVANNPRLVKEADALAAAGHEVRVVSIDNHPELSARDAGVMDGRGWRLRRVEAGGWTTAGRVRRVRDALLQRGARLLAALGVRAPRVVDRAVSRHVGALAAASAAQPSDVVIGHNLAALPAAARAARRLGARLGFDAEDLHTGELPDDRRYDAERALRASLERRLLPECDLLTAASDGIADDLVRLYGIARPVVVLNAFPRSERRSPPRRGAGRPPSLYWYSQVIGPDRGVSEALQAVSLLPFPVELHLRGELPPSYETELRALADGLGIADRLHIWPPAPPGELVALAQRHDIGLALEQPVSRNRQVCVTNKLLTYLLAGLAVAATDTIGQRGILEAVPEAGFLYPPGDIGRLAAGLRRLIEQPGALERAKAAALAAADRRFCWEIERERLVRYLTHRPEAAPAPAATATSTFA